MRRKLIIPATQLRVEDEILGDNERKYKVPEVVKSKNTILVAGRVSILVTRSTSKRPVRVLLNPQTSLLITREQISATPPSP